MNKFSLLYINIVLILLVISNGQVVSAVSSCWTGQVYTTANGKTNSTFKKNCLPSSNDACAKVYSGSTLAYYGCAVSSSCNVNLAVSLNLPTIDTNGITVTVPASTVCCYSDNCNGALSKLASKHLLLAVSLFMIIFF